MIESGQWVIVCQARQSPPLGHLTCLANSPEGLGRHADYLSLQSDIFTTDERRLEAVYHTDFSGPPPLLAPAFNIDADDKSKN